jgi:hypothetical protein
VVAALMMLAGTFVILRWMPGKDVQPAPVSVDDELAELAAEPAHVEG